MSWPEIVAASRNVSTIDEVRSILDMCGYGGILGKKTAGVLAGILAERNMVVHAMADANIAVMEAYLELESFMRAVLARDPRLPVIMDLVKAGTAARLKGCPWQPDECYEAAIKRCDDAAAGGHAATLSAYKGISLAALGRNAEALAAHDAAVKIDPALARSHAGRGAALAALGRNAEALAAHDAAVKIDPRLARSHAGRGAALAALGRHAESRKAYGNAGDASGDGNDR